MIGILFIDIDTSSVSAVTQSIQPRSGYRWQPQVEALRNPRLLTASMPPQPQARSIQPRSGYRWQPRVEALRNPGCRMHQIHVQPRSGDRG